MFDGAKAKQSGALRERAVADMDVHVGCGAAIKYDSLHAIASVIHNEFDSANACTKERNSVAVSNRFS